MSNKLHAHWIHLVQKDETYIAGYKVLTECHCSNCGSFYNRPKPVCPHCMAIMDEQSVEDTSSLVDAQAE